MKENRLGDNIKNLREAFGETQEELGAFLNVEKGTISNYELGKRDPSKENIHNIAIHYCVSDEELLNDDIPSLEKRDFLLDFSNENIEGFFPIFSSEKMEKKPNLLVVYEKHKHLYSLLKGIQVNQWHSLVNLGEVLNKLILSYESIPENEFEDAVCANYVGLIILLSVGYSSFNDILKKKTAYASQVVKNNIELKKTLSKIEDSEWDENEQGDFADDDGLIMNCLCRLNSSDEYHDLALYYITLAYFFGCVDNGMAKGFNRRVALEMEKILYRFNNKYVCNIHSLINSSRQSVDDK